MRMVIANSYPTRAHGIIVNYPITRSMLYPAVSNKIHICLIFSWKQRYLVAYIGERKKSIKLQKLAWKVKLSHKMNESRHKVPSDLKLKTAISRFVFQIFRVNKLRWFVSANWIYSLVKNKSVKLPLANKKKFDWLFIVDRIWLVWHTYISHSLTHWPVHNIPDVPTKRYFFYKRITQKVITRTSTFTFLVCKQSLLIHWQL